MTDHNDIRGALRTQLLTVSGLPTDREWENQTFTPPASDPWVRETYKPTTERKRASDLVEIAGQMVWDLFYPLNDGVQNIDDMADAIKTAFVPGTSLSGTVFIDRAERGAADEEETSYYTIPVTIHWRAYTVL